MAYGSVTTLLGDNFSIYYGDCEIITNFCIDHMEFDGHSHSGNVIYNFTADCTDVQFNGWQEDFSRPYSGGVNVVAKNGEDVEIPICMTSYEVHQNDIDITSIDGQHSVLPGERRITVCGYIDSGDFSDVERKETKEETSICSRFEILDL
jgi:hypothetical protein